MAADPEYASTAGASRESLRVGLVGSGIGASLTPAMHMREGAAVGLDYDYVLLDVDEDLEGGAELSGIIDRTQKAGFRGLNITHPFKQAVLPLLDEMDGDVSTIGACNTIVFREGRRIGYNTDWWGFAESFRQSFPGVRTDRVIQLGAGGAGAAVAYGLLTLGVRRLELFDVDRSRAQGLVDRYGPAFGMDRIAVGEDIASALRGIDGVVQTSPVGSLGHPGMPVDPALLDGTPWLIDIIYFPLETELVLAAKSRNLRAVGGGGMAVYQAVRAFGLFTGIAADAQRMAAHFEQIASTRR